MHTIELLFISIVNVIRVLYIPIAFIHSIILYLLMLTEAPLEDIEYYLYLIPKTTKDFIK